MCIFPSSGYAGRTELPDNLKSMFRPIAMVTPDSNLIAEIILFGEGFGNTKVMAVHLPLLTSCLANTSIIYQHITPKIPLSNVSS